MNRKGMKKSVDRIIKLAGSRIVLPAVLIMVIFLSTGYSSGQGKGQSGEKGETVILVSVDSLRSDYLGCYGNKETKTPAIDSLATDGILFERCVTPVPQDLPGHAAIMTGIYPEKKGVFDNGTFRLPEGTNTIASLFKKSGYTTAAVVGSAILERRFGLSQGFDTYSDNFGSLLANSPSLFSERKAEEVIKTAKEIVQKMGSDARVFLWIHLNDPNYDFNPPPSFEKSYKGEIEYSDAQLADFFSFLKKMNRYERATIVLTSDHGMSLGQYDEKKYGLHLYEPNVRIPLVIKLPKGSNRPFKSLSKTVGLIDVAPTILSVAGISTTGVSFDGSNLLSAENTQTTYIISSYHPFFAYGWSILRAADDGAWKYIQGRGKELHKVSKDMKEVTNQLDEHKDIAATLSEKIGEFEKSLASIRIQNNRPNFDFRVVRDLSYLGYVWSPPETFRSGRTSGFEKLADIERAIEEAQRAVMNKNIKDSIAAMRKIIELDRQDYLPLNFLGSFNVFGGRRKIAENFVSDLEKFYPDRAETYHLKGHLAISDKKYDEAINEFLKALKIDPMNSESMYDTACMYSLLNKKEQAVDWLVKAVNAGYDDFKHIAEDPDLINVRDTREFKDIAGKAQ